MRKTSLYILLQSNHSCLLHADTHTGKAINTRKRHLCDDASKTDEYRPQCGEVLRRSNLQSPPGGEDIKIAPEVERKLRKLAEGMKSGGAATTMAEGEAEGSNEEGEGEGLGLKDFEKILKDAGVDIPGMSGMGRKEEL